MLLAVPMRGQELSVHAGEIASGKISIPGSPVSLTLRGSLDASDLDRLATVIREAGTIDLSGIEILPYNGKPVGANITASPAGMLPPIHWPDSGPTNSFSPSALPPSATVPCSDPQSKE